MNSNTLFGNNNLKWFAAIWSIVLIAPLIYFPSSGVLVGHPWKVELLMSLILGILLTQQLFTWKPNNYSISFPSKIVWSIIAPCCLFVLWSAISAFWAGSVLSVAHHTLVWAVYLVFLLLALYIVSKKKLFKVAIFSLGSVISIICFICIIEYIFEEKIGETFGFRYARFAEIFAALLPVFFSFILRLNRKNLVWAILVTSLLWVGLQFSLSRGSLLSAIIGLSVFILLRIFTKKTSTEKRRLIFAVLGLIFVTFLIQISFSSNSDGQKESTFSRITIKEEKDSSNSISKNVRFLFAGVGREMFINNYLTGVGADNFGLEFNKYRAIFSAKPENKSFAEMQQELLPERAHNEYLQILAELGLVGGVIFLWFLWGIFKVGLGEIKRIKNAQSNILTHSAIAGIVAFLVSSLVSSFSFRLMQNGLIFFFLIALLLKNYAIKKTDYTQVPMLALTGLRTPSITISLLFCISLTVFSALKATSQFFVYTAENQQNFEIAAGYYKTAITLDPSNASANYSFGLRLLSESHFQESASQLEQAVEKGLNTTVCYSYLISSQTLENQPELALNTSSKAAKIFPYSVFMRVRYASLLEKFHLADESKKQFEFAQELNKKQAETWRLLINYGALKTSEQSRSSKEVLSLTELNPESAIYAVLTEREIVYPNEKAQFNF